MAAMTTERLGTVAVPRRFAPGRARVRTDSAPRAVRLTSRGRIAVTGVSALLAGLLSVGLAAAAQASHGGQSASGQSVGGRYVTKVTVGPGQSLWTLAEAYHPDVDPRQVMDEIRQLNSMTGDQLQTGQLLWVPRG